MVAEWIKKDAVKHYYVRKINPDETEILQSAVEINNLRWLGLPLNLEEFQKRARNGQLFGAFEEKEGLVGSLSCVQVKLSAVDKFDTWDKATSNGTLANNNPHGDTLLCVAISVKPTNYTDNKSPKLPNIDEQQLRRLAKFMIKDYIASDLDHVLNFHRKTKGGLPGATIYKVLENGRPDDSEAMGYNVLMEYPQLTNGTKIIRSNATTPSILLIEHALLYAKEHGMKHVIAYSRPAGFRHYLISLSSKP